MSIHQNYRRAVTYKGLQGDKDLEALHGEQGSTEDGIPDSAGPDIIEAPIPTADKGHFGSYLKLCDFTSLFMTLQAELRLNKKDH